MYLSVGAQTRAVEQPGNDATAAGQNQSSGADQSQASAVADPGQTRGLIHIVPFGRVASGLKNTFAPTGAHLTYWGGPVISNIKVVVVFWGPNVVTTSAADGTATLSQFFTDITSSRYFDLLTEYTTAGIKGNDGVSTSNQSIGHGSFVSAVTITPSLCPGGATACTVTDTQIQTELTNQINAAVLPGPQTDAHGIVDTYYAVYFPPNVNIQLDATTKSCVKGGFCAYHSNTGSNIPYGVMADFSSGGCSVGCGSGTTLQIATAVSSHEMSEAITDAQVGSASALAPPLAWYDPDPAATPLGEIGDICGGQDVTVSAGSNTYKVQQEFSNLQNDCVTAPPAMKMPASGAGPNVPFNLALTVQSSATAATLSNYTGSVHFTSSDPLAVLPADYTFVGGDAGSHTFQFTLNTLGNQTISVADTRSSGFTGSTTVNIGTAIDLATSVSPSQLAALPGANGLTLATSVRNNGSTPTSGSVSLVIFSCSGLPTAASCSFSPASLTSSGNVTMTVSTTARAAVANGPRPGNRNPWLLLGLLSLAAMAGFCLRARTQPRRVRRLAPIFGTCTLLIAGVLAGCGGGSSKPPTVTNPIVGTPAGTYVVTFTATSANGTASQTMKLIVN